MSTFRKILLAQIKKASSSGGGASGYTFINSAGTSGITGDTTSDAIDTSGANLLIAVAVGQGVTHPTIIDSKSNGGWAIAVDWFSSRISIFYNINPTFTGSNHTVTIQTASACNVFFIAFSKVGGSPIFQTASAGASSGNWSSSTVSSGNITPDTGFNLFLSACGFDVGTGVGDACNSSFIKFNSPLLNPGNLGSNASYKIKSSNSTDENPGWTRGVPNNSDCWVIQGSWK